jgi:hypothetical protein
MSMLVDRRVSTCCVAVLPQDAGAELVLFYTTSWKLLVFGKGLGYGRETIRWVFVAERLVSSGLEAPQILPLQPRSPGCLQRGGHKDGDTAQGCNLDSAPTISI